MNNSRISVRYSRALFESALEKKMLDKVYNDMIFISEVCILPDMKELLTSPIIVPSKKTAILHKIIGNNIQNITLSLIDLLVQNGRESFLPAVARVFIHQTKEHNGITESVLTTAVKVDNKIKKQIVDLVSGIFKTKVDLKEIVDKEIIGGFILRIEDNYIDASIKNKLRKIEKELKGRSLTAG
ncbi:MAG: ATP synthase F1 subunit delta [Bacteroidales bacterium]|jgi:F-type H+-transporting ATPase subunit delta|nr:ATP synthase F1 subunit delta [Bacteroidales bacterium]